MNKDKQKNNKTIKEEIKIESLPTSIINRQITENKFFMGLYIVLLILGIYLIFLGVYKEAINLFMTNFWMTFAQYLRSEKSLYEARYIDSVVFYDGLISHLLDGKSLKRSDLNEFKIDGLKELTEKLKKSRNILMYEALISFLFQIVAFGVLVINF